MINRSWTEIDLNQIKQNYLLYKSALPKGTQVMAVVKADAYGHGDIQVSKILQKEGVVNFAVSNVNEGSRLRQSGITGQILVLGYTPPDGFPALYENGITQAVISEEYAELISQSGLNIQCQFALDTGMNRIGLDADDPDRCEDVIRNFAKQINVTGIFTHLCVADTGEGREFTWQQIRKYEAVVNRIKDLQLSYCHCLNSAGGLWHNTELSCFVRLGIILYGLKPDYSNIIPKGIKPALSWKSVVSMVKIVHAGESIGYGRSYVASNDMRIATIPTGYADGYNRQLSNVGYVLINGKRANITGRVCMDQMMVDVTDIDNVKMGTEVVLLGCSGEEALTADDMAQMVGTIGYEIVCNINSRVERRYKQ